AHLAHRPGNIERRPRQERKPHRPAPLVERAQIAVQIALLGDGWVAVRCHVVHVSMCDRVKAFLLLFLVACVPGPVRKLSLPRPPQVDATLGPGDLFDVRVFGENDLSGTYRVDADGWIDYPLV